MRYGTSEYYEYLASREWALLREQVRQRSGGWCERCYSRRMQACHHLTYERVGREKLEDLQAICNPCHEYVSGKSQIDPIVDGIKVYLAGPITHTRWRDELLVDAPHDGGIDCSYGPNNYLDPGQIEDLSREPYVLRAGLRGGFDFVGPYFVDTWGGHGSDLIPSHHGMEKHDNCGLGRINAFNASLTAIQAADIIFAWVPTLNPFPTGTIYELGYAKALGKYTALVCPRVIEDELWFVCYGVLGYDRLANGYVENCDKEDNLIGAWTLFTKFFVNRSPYETLIRRSK